MAPRVVRVLAVLAVLALGVTACGEAGTVDDGTQSLPLAGLGAEIDGAGVEVVVADLPAAATAATVQDALAAADIVSPTVTRAADVDAGVVAFDPAATAGLLSLVSDGPRSTLVLVFSGPDAAAVFAAGAPEIFSDAAREKDRQSLLSGNLVGYVAPDGGRPARLRSALEVLSGAPSASATTSS